MPPIKLWCALPTAVALALLVGAAKAQVLDKNQVPDRNQVLDQVLDRVQLPDRAPESTQQEAPDNQLENPADETPLDLSGEPLDLSTPEPGSDKLKSIGALARPSASGWDGKVGIEVSPARGQYPTLAATA